MQQATQNPHAAHSDQEPSPAPASRAHDAAESGRASRHADGGAGEAGAGAGAAGHPPASASNKRRQDVSGSQQEGNALAPTAANNKRRQPSDSQEQDGARRTSGGNEWLRAWAWKREHRPDKVRFDRPYSHSMRLPNGEEVRLTVHQQRFQEQGFASTVWDSSIVLAKFFEKHAARFAGAACLDISAGCGLPGLALAKLGAGRVVATDLGPNLPLLRKNAEANGCSIEVVEHAWGSPVDSLRPPIDCISACDVMYICEAVPPLVASLLALSGPQTVVYVAHGRNRQAEPEFRRLAGQHFSIELVGSEELDECYQCADVDVLRLRLLPAKRLSDGAAADNGAAAEGGRADEAAGAGGG